MQVTRGKHKMRGELTVRDLLKDIRIANSVMKLNEDIDEVAKSFEVTVAKVKKCVRELNRNAKTLNFMWQKAKENRS